MSKFSLLFSAVLLVMGGFVIARIMTEETSYASNQDKVEKKTSDGAAKLDALKKKTQQFFSEWCKKTQLLDEPKMRLARMTSPEQAKITFSTKVTPLLMNQEPKEIFFSFIMSYYDGVWTVLKYEPEWKAGDDGFGMPNLVLSLDEALGK